MRFQKRSRLVRLHEFLWPAELGFRRNGKKPSVVRGGGYKSGRRAPAHPGGGNGTEVGYCTCTRAI